jgi:hypothetical protein
LQSFTPIIARCFDVAADESRILQPGDSVEDNLNLTFGAAGFPFAEPGFYEITAYLVIYRASEGRELIAPSQSVRIRVAAPHSPEEEQDSMMLFTSTVGRYFALGGTVRSKAEEMLEEVLDRRLRGGRGRGKKAEGTAPRDPVAVNIIRSRAFRLNRNYHGRVDGAVKFTHAADPDAAGEQLKRLDEACLRIFDEVTAKDTRTYRRHLLGEDSSSTELQ